MNTLTRERKNLGTVTTHHCSTSFSAPLRNKEPFFKTLLGYTQNSPYCQTMPVDTAHRPKLSNLVGDGDGCVIGILADRNIRSGFHF